MPDKATRINYARRTAYLLGALLVLRVAGIVLSPLNLGPDEAQYWRWGQSLQWGYYSKPPLIAWVIGTVTGVFGDAEWAVRLPAPFLHTLAAWALFILARDMFNARTAMFAALGYILMPGIILSSGLMTTDGVLLPLWSLGLLCLWRLRQDRSPWRYAVGLGLAIGGGFLAKYAMVYFLIGMGLTALIDTPSRKALLSLRGALAGLIALGILSGHLLWSYANGFKTIAHTADNANWGGPLFNLENGLTFLADQMGVAGPIGFIILLIALFSLLKTSTQNTPPTDEADDNQGAQNANIWLACFILPALAIILTQAITARAHANWAATAYAAGSILIAAWLTTPRRWQPRYWAIAAFILFCAAFAIPDMDLSGQLAIGAGLAACTLGFGWANQWRGMGLMWASLSLHGFIGLIFMALAAGPPSWSDTLSLDEAFKRTRGWPATTDALAAIIKETGASAILVDERENWHGLDYYGRGGTLPVPVYTWHRNPAPKSYAETFRLPDGYNRPVLIAAKSKFLHNRIERDFTKVEQLGPLDIQLGANTTRRLNLYLATGFHPVPRAPEWRKLNPEDF